MPDAPKIEVTAGTDRPSPQAQLLRALEAAREHPDGLCKLRLPLTIYDSTGQYTAIREAYWTLTVPAQGTNVEYLELIIETLGSCVRAIAQEGPEAILAMLKPPPTTEVVEE